MIRTQNSPASDTGDRIAAQVLLGQVAAVHHGLERVWVYGGHTGGLAGYCQATLALVLAIVKRSDDMRGFVVLPTRWIVEARHTRPGQHGWACSRSNCRTSHTARRRLLLAGVRGSVACPARHG